MEITNEKLYELYSGLREDVAVLRTDMDNLYKLHIEMRAEHRAEIAELRADITKWGVALFVGSIITITSILGVFITSVVLLNS